MNPEGCTCRYMHRSDPACPSPAPSRRPSPPTGNPVRRKPAPTSPLTVATEALDLIARAGNSMSGRGCERLTVGRCWEQPELRRDSPSGADSWCLPCVAADALRRIEAAQR